MAKVTTVIDIGSNSMRMVVLEKSSRFAFHLVNETKARVKISEGSYANGGNLQEIPMQRAFDSLKSFLNISKSLKSRKIFCVATSAMRDAPNAKSFISKVQKELGLNIRVIDGLKEAYYGGVATQNLIHINHFVTVDIGGGSTEFAFVLNGNIEHCISLDIGTVRLNELFFSKGDIEGAKNYILEKLEALKTCGYEIPKTVVGIGGTIRALGKIIMNKNDYPLDIIHGYTYNVPLNRHIFSSIINAKNKNSLKMVGVKKDRFDTIKEGTLIFDTILDEFSINSVITSGAGVREGVFLNDLLRGSNGKFPANYNVSVRSLLDRYEIDSRQSSYLGSNAAKIFEVLKPLHQLDEKYKTLLVIASKLNSIGSSLNFYRSNDNSFDFILNGLNYDFLHSSRVVIAHILKFSKKSLPHKSDLHQYKDLLPCFETIQWLSFMISLNLTINQDFSNPTVSYKLKESRLKVYLKEELYLARSGISKLELPKGLAKIKVKS